MSGGGTQPARSSRGGTLAVSWGEWGGFYLDRGWCTRLCIGWVAITYLPVDFDDLVLTEGGGDLDALAERLREFTRTVRE